MPFTGIPVNRLRKEVGTSEEDDELLTEVLVTSLAMLNELVRDTEDLPDVVFDQAHLAVAVDMFNRRKAPNGVLWQQFDNPADGSGTAAPLRLSNDPLRPAYPLLSMWLEPVVGGTA